MGYAFSLSELASDLGTSTSDGLRNIANTAADFACSALQAEGAISASLGLSDFPVVQAQAAFTNALCAPRGKPFPTPSPRFSGGQCPKFYTVNYTAHSDAHGDSTGNVFNVLGPIRGVVLGQSSLGRPRVGIKGQPQTGMPDGVSWVLELPPSEADGLTATINSVTPVSGTDTCGNPPPQTKPVVPPPSTYKSPIVNINLGAGITVPVTMNVVPVIIPVGVVFSPSINVDVGGINVGFDAGGVTINVGNSTGGDITLPSPGTDTRPSPPPPIPPTKQTNTCDDSDVLAAIAAVKSELDGVKTELDDIKDCTCPVPYTMSSGSLGSGQSGYFAISSLCSSVRLVLTAKPANPKVQDGAGQPPFYFCGYAYWGDGVGRTPRLALSGVNNVFYPPAGATAFGFVLYDGYTGAASQTYKVPSKPGAEASISQLKEAAK